MTWHTWALFTFVTLLLCLTPGPAVLFVVTQALRFGGPRSIWAALGIVAANGVFFGLSALGLGAVLLASPRLFLLLQYVGAGYLIILGLTTLRGRGLALPSEATVGDSAGGRLNLLGRGILLQAANPKALLYFTALLPQFIHPEASVAYQVLILGVTGALVEMMVMATYGSFAGRLALMARQPRFAMVTNRVSGSLLVAAGAGLALTA